LTYTDSMGPLKNSPTLRLLVRLVWFFGLVEVDCFMLSSRDTCWSIDSRRSVSIISKSSAVVSHSMTCLGVNTRTLTGSEFPELLSCFGLPPWKVAVHSSRTLNAHGA